MNGPEHYRRAEGCMDAAEALVQASRGKRMPTHEAEALRGDVLGTLAAAQVHATLALAAATIAGSNAEWRDALGVAK